MAIIFREGFETDGSGTRYTTGIPQFSDGSYDFFTRTDGTGIGSGYEVTGATGSHYFAAQDIDGEGAALPATLSFDGIDISGLSGLSLSIDLAEDDASDGNEDWDSGDSFLVEYRIDGGAWAGLFLVQNDGSTFNSAPLLGGTALTSQFQTFSSAIAGAGSLLDLRLTFQFDSGDEDIAIDEIVLSDGGPTGPGPDPDPGPTSPVRISEIDADQDGTDSAEFVELFDGGAGNTSLDGLTLVLFNGNGDAAYTTIPLDGYSTNEDGYFVIGSDLVDNVDLVAWTTNGLQNGADAVALYLGGAPATGEAATTTNLVDAVVYGTNDAADTGLLAALGQTVQYDEDANGDSEGESLIRQGDGSFVAGTPSPGGAVPPVQPPQEVLISQIQGTAGTSAYAVSGVDDVSPLAGTTVSVTAVVTADFMSGLRGFYLQEEDADWDDNPLTSEGVFVFAGALDGLDVAVGDLVTVTGTVGEYSGQTQISAMSVEAIASGVALPSSVEVEFPVANVMIDGSGGYVANLEAYEGMLIDLPQEMLVTELFNLDRFGEYQLSTDRFEQFTQFAEPDAAGNDAYLQQVARSSVYVDDGASAQNPAEITVIDGNDGVLSPSDTFSMGDTLSRLSGVLGYGFDQFRLQDPTGTYENTQVRPESPEDVGGNFRAAGMNVLNYFTTLSGNTDIGLEARGANSAEEFERQAGKIVDAILEIDADVFGLVEIENDFAGADIAVADLVARLNAELGQDVYAWVDPGQEFVGTDAIANALIYRTDRVETVGDMAILTEFEGRDFLDPLGAGRDLNRAAIAQTFEDLGTGQLVTVSVNHLKSKGSLSGLPEDEDQGDGAGNNDATREAAADILADWLASDPTGTGASRQLVLGDFNAYAQEDPIDVMRAAGFTDLAAAAIEDPYSYVFDGLVGTLDYAFANERLASELTGATEWHINSNEADAFDYNLDFGRDPDLYDETTAARYSDHDPVIVGFDLRTLIEGTDRRDVVAGTAAGDEIVLGRGTDVAFGGGGDDLIFGGAGGDYILGGDGDDEIDGGEGNDRILGGAGDDRIVFGEGRADLLFGGSGSDAFVFADGAAGDGDRGNATIFDFDVRHDVLDLGGVEVARVQDRFLTVTLTLEGDGDRITLLGVRDADDIVFADDLLSA
ncbi:ExeM/NucH family extracellular endonuclease [Wenxinia saemankumensis]|uniref:Predicted extracellular nuclease n=1 Tax=Wenxinia saemankumensis TaxID=1447782 RepID=A0A1M6A078_9RHOB|nr:ExeM/NucH family extracellular endonuclease [Wenxinia saemankumensis]SHI29931.1 Predicted extracellular nuclease [Wenxinia saemankumensis]